MAQDQHDLIAIICIWMQLTGPVLSGNQVVCNTHAYAANSTKVQSAGEKVFILWISLRFGTQV